METSNEQKWMFWADLYDNERLVSLFVDCRDADYFFTSRSLENNFILTVSVSGIPVCGAEFCWVALNLCTSPSYRLIIKKCFKWTLFAWWVAATWTWHDSGNHSYANVEPVPSQAVSILEEADITKWNTCPLVRVVDVFTWFQSS